MSHVPSAKPSCLFRLRGVPPRAVRSGDHQYIARFSAAGKKMSGFLIRGAGNPMISTRRHPRGVTAKRLTGEGQNSIGWDPFRTRRRRRSPTIERRESTDFVEDPSVLAPALGICGDVSEADSWLFASCGEDGRRERNDLRQLSEVLGGGGQQELIFGSTRPTQAQSIQPEDALQMSEEHLDLLSFAT